MYIDTALKEYLVNLPAKRLQKMRRTSRRRHKKSISTTSSNATVKVLTTVQDDLLARVIFA